MEQQRENGEGSLKNLSDEQLQAVDRDAEDSLVESELGIHYWKLSRDRIREEAQFRTSGKPKRPPEEWDALWERAVREVGERHGLGPTEVWEVARRLIARAKAEEAGNEDETKGHRR